MQTKVILADNRQSFRILISSFETAVIREELAFNEERQTALEKKCTKDLPQLFRWTMYSGFLALYALLPKIVQFMNISAAPKHLGGKGFGKSDLTFFCISGVVTALMALRYLYLDWQIPEELAHLQLDHQDYQTELNRRIGSTEQD